MATVPYLTEDQIRKNYTNAYNAYDAQRKAEADRATTAANTQLANQQRSNYVNYRMNQRDLPEQLARQGITGGASETSALRSQMNYENNTMANERQNASRLADINNAYLDAMNTYKMTADQNMNEEIARNRELRANYEKQLQQEAEQRFANTISGYDNISTIDKLMDSIRKSGVDTWRIDYLRARRAELVAAQQALAASSSGGGGGYYRSSGSSSGGSSGGGSQSGTTASPKAVGGRMLDAFGVNTNNRKTSSKMSSKAKRYLNTR